MGEEISQEHFDQQDFDRFNERLREETSFVRSLFEQQAFDNASRVLGYELELCLVDAQGHPSKVNQQVLDDCANPLLTMELAKFNLEINGNPFDVDANVLSHMDTDLSELYLQVQQTAVGLGAHTVLFGVLPSLHRQHLHADDYMSEQHRYNQLSHQLIKMRGRPVHLELQGEECLRIDKNDVMLEALGTSLQIHMQVPFDEAVDTYNAALWASMLVLGATPNSPLVLGKCCWQESRIGIFKQAVDTRNQQEIRDGIIPRVHFGKAYIDSMLDLFEDNFYYSPILPEVIDKPIETLHHFNLHNGTIWRWVRPILGVNSNGDYHLRLELRVVPSGPTLVDTMANTAFYLGLTEGLKRCGDNLRARDFSTLETDFYRAAQYGMQARVHWIDGHESSLKNLILSHALPLARQGLEKIGILDSAGWLDIIEARVISEQTGANWILRHWKQHGDTSELVQTYLQHANTNTPVHLWPAP
ncbi:MAG: glutamate--cysteine ligase [Gammaproteobacteria bacterium]|nr:MAG: glutamate--cysteine ligase [Gammaproteobacteria bacterium]